MLSDNTLSRGCRPIDVTGGVGGDRLGMCGQEDDVALRGAGGLPALVWLSGRQKKHHPEIIVCSAGGLSSP